jgi:hypothetical protein
MCLIVSVGNKQPQPKQAKRNIQVFEVIDVFKSSPYKNMIIDNKVEPWTRGFVYKEPDFLTTALRKGIFDSGNYKWEVHGNAFHSFLDEYFARLLTRNLGLDRYLIAQMYIPKGEYYFIGRNGIEVASSALYYPPENELLELNDVIEEYEVNT